MIQKSIPTAVLKEASWFLRNCDGSLQYLGAKDGMRYWHFVYAKDGEFGFPVVFGFDGKHASQLSDEEALRACHVFCR
jgi:hypothetical protein